MKSFYYSTKIIYSSTTTRAGVDLRATAKSWSLCTFPVPLKPSVHAICSQRPQIMLQSLLSVALISLLNWKAHFGHSVNELTKSF